MTNIYRSGKSNILDAICFLLGITNLTHVRAANLQELVYKRILKDLLGTPWVGRVSTPRWACLPSSFQAKSKQYCGPNGPTASIFYGI